MTQQYRVLGIIGGTFDPNESYMTVSFTAKDDASAERTLRRRRRR